MVLIAEKKDRLTDDNLAPGISDEFLIGQVLAGHKEMFEPLMRRYNERLFRVSRSIVGDADEAEDIMQHAWVRAYSHLDRYEGRSLFATWVTKIAVYEAMARKRKSFQRLPLNEQVLHLGQSRTGKRQPSKGDPESSFGRRELRALLEKAVSTLSPNLRLVFVMRDVEGMSTSEAAESLGLSRSTVKVRLFRARFALRRWLQNKLGDETHSLFRFYRPRCDRVVIGVFKRLKSE